MKTIFTLWALPLIFFWGWFALSFYDMHFGVFFLSKAFHDHLFTIYGNILGMAPADVPLTLAWLFFVDSAILLGVTALGAYRKIWFPYVADFVKVHILRRKPKIEIARTHLDQFYSRSETKSFN